VHEKRDEARKLIADGVDPAATRKAKKLARVETLEGIAAEWMELPRKKFTAKSMLNAEWISLRALDYRAPG
jgi:hypothetical protein